MSRQKQRRISYTVTDFSELAKEYPELVRQEQHIVYSVTDARALGELVRAMHKIGRKVPGVTVKNAVTGESTEADDSPHMPKWIAEKAKAARLDETNVTQV